VSQLRLRGPERDLRHPDGAAASGISLPDGRRPGPGELVAIGFVSIALNHLLAGGVTGHSLRLLLMRPRGMARRHPGRHGGN
jgi:hypothetical protein